MKIKELIKKLQKLEEKHGNLEIVIDYDEHGWYNAEKVEKVDHYFDGECHDCFINIKSSNEI